MNRRNFVKLAGLGGVVFTSGLARGAGTYGSSQDEARDDGAAYRELIGPTHYAFDHRGVHFIALDNVSDRAARIGDEQLGWLKADLEKRKRDERIVVLAHRPLFPLYPQWDWATR